MILRVDLQSIHLYVITNELQVRSSLVKIPFHSLIVKQRLACPHRLNVVFKKKYCKGYYFNRKNVIIRKYFVNFE